VKEITTMAMVRVAPVTVQVRTDWVNGIPREIRWGEDRLQVTRLVSVRDEARAYPAITGPRTLFEVDTPGLRLALTFQHRSRRWTIEGLDGLPAAA
jgi:hypothetical protein